ncbi:phosphopentomutase [Stygiobacter electus]|uniref:Phosphopentomutase n=1 Tax=Stygiobacter electus TaxID=3032292 RepID=A0AAE3NVW6_9BACT|nr:phosphopentomutase [Stygiobacter electus]MDF1611031.1 phosphopentomutase [Stygiobacter electus]
MNNFIVIVLDGVGIGELPDAFKYNDQGSNTLANMAIKVNGLKLPNLEKLGLGNIAPIKGINFNNSPLASYGKMIEQSVGKDSTTGHWELGGIITTKEFPVFPNGFPKEIIDKFIAETGVKGVLGNYAASGTQIIEDLGEEHVKTGYPIVYTSADSVFQIAAHEEIIPLKKLYEICKITREKVMTNENEVGRIIARPFITLNGKFTRTTNRKDFSVTPPKMTILNYLENSNIETIAIGKVNDLFNYYGIKHQLKTKSNNEGIDKIIFANKNFNNSFIFANLVDFDVYYGHRNDAEGFHLALQEFDKRLPEILNSLDENDYLILTADHGNDPTDISTDHTREYVPLLFYNKLKKGKNLGVRNTFADVAQTIANFFKVNNDLQGNSFLNE